LGKKQDPNKTIIGNAPNGGGPRPAPRLRRRDEVDELLDGGEEAAPQGDQGYGFYIHRDDLKDMNAVFTTELAAENYAKEQAEKNPKTLYGVFGCVKVFETTTPTIIEKTYNDAGELLVVVKT
jgi:hypothetical protein